MTAASGRVVRFADTELATEVAHGGTGELRTARVLDRPAGEFVTFLDLTEVPAGVTVGRHTHGPDDEEVYVIVEGAGEVEVDGLVSTVGPGDVVINAPGGTHALRAVGPGPLRMVVVDVARVTPPGRA